MILLIQHHLIRSHLAVVCNGATVSMATMQTVLDQYQTFSPTISIQLNNAVIVRLLWNILGVWFLRRRGKVMDILVR